MGGRMYLGNQLVTPVILQGTSDVYTPTYKIVNGVALPVTTLSGKEFENVVEIKSEAVVFADYSLSGVINMPNLEIVDDDGLSGSFELNQDITGFLCPKLKTARDYAFSAAFRETGISTVRFQSLDEIGEGCFDSCFYGCNNLTDLYFDSVKTSTFEENTDQFTAMLPTLDTQITIHFPSNMESTIENLDDYPNFGGTSGKVTLLYDLPATT